MFSAERFRTYYYDCMPYQSSPPTPQETERYRAKDRFISSLRHNPRFEVRLGRLARHEKCGEIVFEQKGVDIYLSIDLALLSGRRDIQKAVLVTADSDFVPAINAAKEAGVLCAVCYSRKYRKPHDQLLYACDERFDFDGLIG